MLSSHCVRSALLVVALGTLASPLTAAPAVQTMDTGHRASLNVGPLIGGQNLVVDFRSTHSDAFGALFFGFDNTPLVGSGFQDPVFGLDLAAATMFLRVLDNKGRDFVSLPSAMGDFGPVGAGIVVHFQYVIAPDVGPWVTSNLVSIEGEPSPLAPGFLVDDAAARLPAGYDALNAGQVEAGDLDRDGDTDLVLTTETDLLIWMNDGSGVFVDETALRINYPSGTPTGALSVLDVNGDNHIDIMTGGGFDDSGSTSFPDRLWLNLGGQFQESTAGFPFPDGFTQGFEFGDFNGDGYQDVVVETGEETHVSSVNGFARLYFGDSQFNTQWTEDLTFVAQPWNDPDVGVNGFAAGDIDGDGDLDLVASRIDISAIDGTAGQPNLVLLNDGLGTFTDASAASLFPNPSDNTQGVTLADLDLDGDLDLIFANSHASIPAASAGDLYFNQGGLQGGVEGVFIEDASSELEITTPADWVRLSARAADADADGDLDLFMTVHDLFAGADQLLFLNDGGRQGGTLGVMKRQFWFDPGDFISYDAAFLDMDADGDLDVIQAAQGVVTGDPLLGDDVRLYENSSL